MSVTDRIASLSPEQRALFERLRGAKKPAAPRGHQPPPVPRRGPGELWPLSFDQERLWFLYSLNPLETAYNIDTASRIRGPLDMPSLSRAFQEIPRRHESWRTTFRVVDGKPVQVVAPEVGLPSPVVDLRALPAELREPMAYRLMREEARHPFVLETGPLVRALLLRLGDEDCICQLTVHHIVTDWVTFQLFWYELGVLYEAYAAGRAPDLPEPPVQYADFTVWQRDWMQGEVLATYRDYWMHRLAGAPLVLELPTDRPRPAVQTSHGDRVAVLVERAAELKSLARREGLTPFMAVLAVYQILLSRHAGQEKVIVGSPNANRNRKEIERVFGFFLTQLAFCTDLGGDPTLREVLRRVRDVALGAYAHQELPFGKLVEALQPERELSRAPIIQVVLLLLDGSVLDQKLADLDLHPVDIHDGNARYDVMFAMWDQPERMLGWYEYNCDLWDATTAVRMVDGFYRLIEALLADPGMRISQVAVVSEAERHQILVEWNDTAVPLPDCTALDLFAARAAERPEAPALVWEGHVTTYGELDRRADQLAARLRGLGVRPGARVGVCLERSPDMIAALLAAWKAAAAYVPLDPEHPAERLGFVLADSAAAALITSESVLAPLAAAGLPAGLQLLLADALPVSEAPAAGDSTAVRPLPASPAYAIYTSGSTGRPKGAEVPHSALINLLRSVGPWCSTGVDDAWMAVTTISFDISVFEIFLPLTTGARIVLGDRETALDGGLLAAALEAGGATHLQATPATWRQLVDSGWAGRPGLRRLSSGEALSRDLAAELLALCGDAPFWNLYGPTETTIWSTGQRLEPGDRRATTVVTLGRPLDNTQAYVLDRTMRPVPRGAKGEVFLGGAGLAQGYLGRPGLTAERFVPDSLSGEPGARLYRTGDFVRLMADGVLDFLGRADEQVKLRGFRIEPGEIEACLRQHPGVADAVVLLRRVRAGDDRLAAYVVPVGVSDGAAAASAEELRDALRRQLPDYMVPAAFIQVDALPITPNGKVDRQELARIGPAELPAAGVAPRTATERTLAGFWEEVLGAAPAGVDADFFTSGGHSLLATQLVLRIRDAFGLDLPVRAVFGAPTVAAQAEMIDGLLSSAAGPAAFKDTGPVASVAAPIRPLPRPGYPFRAPLSFAQERLWFLDRLVPGSAAYTMPLALRVRGELDPVALERAFAELVLRHETLRTSFAEESGRPVQVIGAPAGWVLSMEKVAEPLVLRRAQADAALPFDIERGPLLRTSLLRLGPAEHVLLLSMHHIVSDLWSMGVLVYEMAALYAGASLPALPVQYADFAAWQRAWLQGGELERQIAFWRQSLAGAPPALELPTDRPRPARQSTRGASLAWSAGAGSARALEELGRRHGATLFMVLTTALATLLSRFSGQDDLVLGSPIANRQRPEIAGLIGMFVNTLALRVNLSGESPFAELLARVRDTALDAYAHQDVPFEKLVEVLEPRRDPGRHPLFQVVLAMQNVPLGTVELPGLTLEPLEVESAATKFDLTLSLHDAEGELIGRLEYAADLFDRASVERIAGALRNLLTSVAASPGTPFRELPLLAPEERRQILVDWNRTVTEFPRQATVHELFAGQAAAAPAAVAVVHGTASLTVSLTYSELARRADRLARRLLALGLRPEERVGLCAGRSPDLIAALLAILKAGGAYLPLDPSHPPERLAWILRDAGARLLLTERRLLSGLAEAAPGGLPVLFLEDLLEDWAAGEEPPALPLPAVPAESLAYVMYTSGSTGVPKGVAVTHRNVVRLVRGTDYAEMGAEQTWLQFAPVSFDAATLEIWAPLLNGGRLALVPGERASLDDLAAAIERHGVTSLWLTAGLFHQMVDHRPEGLRPLRQLLAGGDAVSPAHARRVLEALPGLTLIDGYGPTEGTTFTCCHRMTEPRQVAALSVPIGRPIANARVYVLDAGQGPVPPGVAGELYIGGEGLARGYLGRPELTAERFVPDPFAAETGRAGERLYRTGDRVRWVSSPSGEDRVLEFLGRADHQVKIRGFRVEAGEVKAALAAHPAVRQAVVLARDAAGGGKELVAYAVTAEPMEAGEIQRFLRKRLPEPMVPAVWIFVDALPLTPNGKVDRRVLAGAAGLASATRAGAAYLAPRTPLETHLVEACAEVLGLERERVGVLDNFFDLGGHSLLATQLTAQLRQRCDVEVPLQLVFDAVHLADLAERITERELAGLDTELLETMMAELGEGE